MKTHVLVALIALFAIGLFAQTPAPPSQPSGNRAQVGIHVGGPLPDAPPKAAAAPAPAVNPQLKQLQYFAGTWQCTGNAFATDFGPAHPSKAKVSGTWELNNNWLLVRYTEEKTAKNPMPYAVAAYWGWDVQSKSFTDVAVDDMGGFSTGNSPGWSGNVMTFSGPTHGGGATVPSRDTFTKVSEKELKHLGEAQVKGAWVKLDEETCKR